MKNELDNFFKVILHSSKATVVNNEYTWRVNLADVQGSVLRCGVQSVISSGDIVASFPYHIHIKPIMQMRSFDSKTGTHTNVVFTSGRTNQDYILQTSVNDVATVIAGDSIRGSTYLSVQFSDFDYNIQPATNPFQITLWFYEVKK